MTPTALRVPATLLAVAFAALSHDALAQRRPRRPRRPVVTTPTPPTAPGRDAPAARGDDPAASQLPLNQAVNVSAGGNTLRLTGSRAWPVASALAWFNEDGALTMLLHSSPVACPSSLPERMRLANMMSIDCPQGACRMLLFQVPLQGRLETASVEVRSPSAVEQQYRTLGTAMQGLDPNNPAAVQAAVAQMQQAANARPAFAALSWKNAATPGQAEAATSGQFVVSAVQGTRVTGRFALQFDGAPSPRATGTPTLDGSFEVTLCPR